MENEIWYEFFSSLYHYCVEKNDFIYVNCDLYDYELEFIYSTFPYYYSADEEKKRFKKLPYDNYYEVFNVIRNTANIAPVDVEESLKNEFEYEMWKIELPFVKNDKNLYFIIFFVVENSGKKTYRILYYYGKDDTLGTIVKDIKDLPIYFPKDNSNIKEAQHFLSSMVALAQYANIELPIDLQERFPNLIIELPPCIKDFGRVIELINLNPFNDDIKATAQRMYNKFIEEDPVSADPESEDFEDTSFSGRFDLINNETNTWESDWKFDFYEAQTSIQELLLNKNWTFDYHEDLYSEDLFPYIQKSLDKSGLILMNIETWGDYRVFFIAKKENIEEILKLSRKLVLELNIAELHEM